MRELEQRQKSKSKQRADPEEDLRISELRAKPTTIARPVHFSESVEAKSVVVRSRGSTAYL
jgi:hypothetical protein